MCLKCVPQHGRYNVTFGRADIREHSLDVHYSRLEVSINYCAFVCLKCKPKAQRFKLFSWLIPCSIILLNSGFFCLNVIACTLLVNFLKGINFDCYKWVLIDELLIQQKIFAMTLNVFNFIFIVKIATNAKLILFFKDIRIWNNFTDFRSMIFVVYFFKKVCLITKHIKKRYTQFVNLQNLLTK